MINPATILKEAINCFSPTPISDETISYYHPTAKAREGLNYEVHQQLYKKIILSANNSSGSYKRFLVMGQRGCGKSSELYMLTTMLRNSLVLPIAIDITDNLENILIDDSDLNKSGIVKIFELIKNAIVEYATHISVPIDKKFLEAYEESKRPKKSLVCAKEDKSGTLKECDPSKLRISIKQPNTVKMSKPSIADVLKALNAIIKNFAQINMKQSIVIILDGLEKYDYDEAKKLFEGDFTFKLLSAIDAHLIMVCPISLRYAPEVYDPESVWIKTLIPAIKIRNTDCSIHPDGIDVIKKLVFRRAVASLFEDSVLEAVIAKTGGNLRLICKKLQDIIEEACINHKEKVDMNAVNTVFDRTWQEQINPVYYKYRRVLKDIYEGNLVESNEVLADMLKNELVFEYDFKHGQYYQIDLHPSLREHFDKYPEKINSL